jgi:hypothetical protein
VKGNSIGLIEVFCTTIFLEGLSKIMETSIIIAEYVHDNH